MPAKKKQRTQIKDLPKKEKELTTKEQKQVQGGVARVVPPGIRDPRMENDVNPQ